MDRELVESEVSRARDIFDREAIKTPKQMEVVTWHLIKALEYLVEVWRKEKE